MLPLSNVWFVDQGAAAGGNGSIGQPYNTLAAALTAHAAGGTFILTPYDYSAEVIAAPLANGDWSFWGLQLGSWPEGFSAGDFPSPQSLTLLPSLTIGTGGSANQVALRSVFMSNLAVEQGCSVVLQDVVLDAFAATTGPAGGALLRADRCYFNGSGVGGAGMGDCQFNDCGFFGSQTLDTAGTNVQLTRCFGETSITFAGSAGVVNYDPFSRGRVSIPALTNGFANLVGVPGPLATEALLTCADVAAGATGNSTALTIAGAPYSSSSTLFNVTAAVQFAGTTAAAYIEVLAQLQQSTDGGATWSNIGNARTISQVVNNNPTWFGVTLPGLALASGADPDDLQIRVQLSNAVGSGGTISSIDIAITAAAASLI